MEFVRARSSTFGSVKSQRGSPTLGKESICALLFASSPKAGYTVEAMEIPIPLHFLWRASLLEEYSVFRSSEKWDATDTRIAKDVACYELMLSRKKRSSDNQNLLQK